MYNYDRKINSHKHFR